MPHAASPHEPTKSVARVPLQSGPPATSRRGELLVDRELRELFGSQILVGPQVPPIGAAQLQAASLDLRLGPVAHQIRAGFLPGATSIDQRLAELETARISLADGGAVLERGLVYLVALEERLALEPGLRATFNPRSSTGRCDVFTRVLAPGAARFNETAPGYAGRLWLEISPLSFPVRLSRGDRLCQMRLSRGEPALTRAELLAEYRREPLCWRGDEPIPESEIRFGEDGSIELHLGLAGRDPCGFRARSRTGVLRFAGEAEHDAADFWEALPSSRGRAILAPGGFYIFASRERVVIPPHLSAEMLPVDVGIGEMRNNYAGFFDNGFGWRPPDEPGRRGTAAVLEVRAHDVPFLVEDGQVFFSLRYYRASQIPEKMYAEGRGGKSYRDQDLTLARVFRPWRDPPA